MQSFPNINKIFNKQFAIPDTKIIINKNNMQAVTDVVFDKAMVYTDF